MQVQWGVAPGAPVQGLIGIAVARVHSGGSVMSTDVRFFVGIDWASETHQVCLVAADGKIIGERAFAHGGAGLAEMCDWLVTTSGEEPPTVAVAIEAPHGPVVEILLERRFQVDAVNPKQLDRFRDRFTVAGAKDDRRDAYVLADALRTDRHCFRRLTVEDPVVIELREWSRMAEDLQASAAWFSCVKPVICGCARPSTIGPASPSSTTFAAAPAMRNCASEVIAMAAPCGVSPTASPSPAPCSRAKQPSIQNMLSRPSPPDLRPIPWFDRDNHPFVPTCLQAERRAQWKSPRRGRSTAEHRALARLTERARRYTPIQGTAPPPCGVTAPQCP